MIKTGNIYRDLFKWGLPEHEVRIDSNLCEILEREIGFSWKSLDTLPGTVKIQSISVKELDGEVKDKISQIVGEDNWSISSTTILAHSSGKSYVDLKRLRHNIYVHLPQMVVYPKTEDEIRQIVQICNSRRIPILPVGGMTSVTQGIEFERGGIALDLTKHYNRIIEVNKTNSTVTVQAGILGPDLEQFLNQTTSETSPKGYTCGHFPQSFEFSTLGGWVATRSAGQESTGYGKIEDLVLGMRVVTSVGTISIPPYPAKATGPELLQLLIGSEGSYGIITQITMKIRKIPPTTNKTAILFKQWDEAILAARRIMQGRFGKPYVFRLSDPDETEVLLETGGIKSWQNWLLKKLGYIPDSRVLLLCTTQGLQSYAKETIKNIKKISKSHGGRNIGSAAVDFWLQERFQTPYLRDTLMDQGLIVDTLETSVPWDKAVNLWNEVRSVILSRPNTLCMSHLSHLYETGTNIYFTFISNPKTEVSIEEYKNYQDRIIRTIIDEGGSLSHHHGIGRLFRPYLHHQFGRVNLLLLRKLKQMLDPNDIMNPGALIPKTEEKTSQN